MTEDFGSYLKHERELRGVSLEEIASLTKIHIRYLNALENNQYDDLPGEVFIKGFIRSYARAIGANVDEWITAYDDSIGRDRREKIIIETNAVESSNNVETKPKKTLFALGAFIVLIVVIAYMVSPENQADENISSQNILTPDSIEDETSSLPNSEDPLFPMDEDTVAEKNISEENLEPTIAEGETHQVISKSDTSLETQQSSETEAPVKKIEIAQKPAKLKDRDESSQVQDSNEPPITISELPEEPKIEDVSSKNEEKISENTKPDSDDGNVEQQQAENKKIIENEINQSKSLAVEAKPFKLEIRVSENSWFNLTIDKGQQQDFILPAGTNKEFQAQQAIRLTIGNRRGTQVILNEEELNLPETADNIIRDLILSEETLG